MRDGAFANRAQTSASDTDAERTRGHRSSSAVGEAGPAAARMLLGLQHVAGNAAVVELLRRGAAPTVSRVAAGDASEVDDASRPEVTAVSQAVVESRQAAEARAAEAAAGGGTVDVDPPVDDPDREHSAPELAQKEAEGEGVTVSDEAVELEGGPPPTAGGDGAGAGFVEGGYRGSVPFTGADAADLGAEPGGPPHAFVKGAAGKIPWSGGGGKGPKGMQRSGSIQELVRPVYESQGNGPFNADAWVNPETGKVTVRRDYMTSSAGDQGPGGWWVSPGAEPALRAHEEKHVKSSRDHYETAIDPVLERIMRSAELGRGVYFFASNAVEHLKGKIAWKEGLEKFRADDQRDNQPQGTIDDEDFSSATVYPRERVRDAPSGPRQGQAVQGGTVAGKRYEHLLAMQSEAIPDLLPLDEEEEFASGTRHPATP